MSETREPDNIHRLSYKQLEEMLVKEIGLREHLERREQLAYTMIAEAVKPKLRVRELEAELERLRAGDFTTEEIHNFCHNLHGKVSAEEFAKGCEAEMVKLYGRCPWAERLDTLEKGVERLSGETTFRVGCADPPAPGPRAQDRPATEDLLEALDRDLPWSKTSFYRLELDRVLRAHDAVRRHLKTTRQDYGDRGPPMNVIDEALRLLEEGGTT